MCLYIPIAHSLKKQLDKFNFFPRTQSKVQWHVNWNCRLKGKTKTVFFLFTFLSVTRCVVNKQGEGGTACIYSVCGLTGEKIRHDP